MRQESIVCVHVFQQFVSSVQSEARDRQLLRMIGELTEALSSRRETREMCFDEALFSTVLHLNMALRSRCS